MYSNPEDNENIYSGLLQINSQYQSISNIIQESLQIQANPAQVQQYNQIQCNLIDDKIKSENFCFALAFNKDSNILISGDRGNIKIWEFKQGHLYYKNTLQRNIYSSVTCLLFSKFSNSFVSGDYQQNITCWKQTDVNSYVWINSQNDQAHQKCVTSIILNQQENQLISCSKDRTIIVWMIDFNTNTIHYEYALEQKHENDIVSISFNLSETTLISCSCDKFIIVWAKDQNQKWNFKYIVSQPLNDYGNRLSFINDNTFIWVSCYQPFINVFNLQNDIFTYQPQKSIQLEEGRDLEAFFPIVYNNDKKLLLVKHGEFVYFFKVGQDGSLVNMINPLNCIDEQSIGTMTNDGQYLIIWIKQTYQHRIYKINYQ